VILVCVVGSPRRHLGHIERTSLIVALTWSAALLVAAVVAPVYQTQSATSSGSAVTGTATLVEVNGWRVMIVVSVPLVCALLVGTALRHRVGRPGAGPVAWTVTTLLAGFNLLAMLSIGVFVLPVTGALATACATHEPRARAA
jgi:hypothetical protein